MQLPNQLCKGCVVKPGAELLDTLPSPCLELINAPSRFRYADDRHGQCTAAYHIVEGRKNLLVSKISGRAEENERVGFGSFCQLLWNVNGHSEITNRFGIEPPYPGDRV